MNNINVEQKTAIRVMVDNAVADVKITDIHTHLYSRDFGELFLWGIDELITYHYLIAETMRWVDMPYEKFWSMSKREQADLIWKTLFIEHSPYSEACRGVLTALNKLGLDLSSRDLDSYRKYFEGRKVEDYIDTVFDVAGLESAVMTNDPFDDLERPVWLKGGNRDNRFHAALRLDSFLVNWKAGVSKLREWGYDVDIQFGGNTIEEIKRFIRDWIGRINPVYMAVSLNDEFKFPEPSARSRILSDCVLPVSGEMGVPLALMIGVRRNVNPGLQMAGDTMGRADITVVEYLCSNYPDNKFLITMLSRENQHELCVQARKFRNLMIFGNWWFLNNPSLIEEITRMRFELLGPSVIPQHSDARIIDQVIYKWAHSRQIIADVLVDKYTDIAATGWQVKPEEVKRDVEDIFGRNFWRFVKR